MNVPLAITRRTTKGGYIYIMSVILKDEDKDSITFRYLVHRLKIGTTTQQKVLDETKRYSGDEATQANIACDHLHTMKFDEIEKAIKAVNGDIWPISPKKKVTTQKKRLPKKMQKVAKGPRKQSRRRKTR